MLMPLYMFKTQNNLLVQINLPQIYLLYLCHKSTYLHLEDDFNVISIRKLER